MTKCARCDRKTEDGGVLSITGTGGLPLTIACQTDEWMAREDEYGWYAFPTVPLCWFCFVESVSQYVHDNRK